MHIILCKLGGSIKEEDVMNQEKMVELLQKAIEAKTKSYSPYSNFKVGAALISEDGRIYTGCNIENASYGLAICAERTTIVKAASDGVRKIIALAINLDSDEIGYPCGACLQVMAEFMDNDAPVLVSNNKGEYKIYKFIELYPFPFRL